VVLPAVFSASMLGLAVIAPALGSRWDTLTYNSATAVLTVVSGALFAPAVNPVVDRVGAVLPLRHSVTALRTRWPGARSAPSSRWRRVSASAGRSLLPCSIAGRTGVDAVTGRARSHRD